MVHNYGGYLIPVSDGAHVERGAPLQVLVNLDGNSPDVRTELTVKKEKGEKEIVNMVTAVITAREAIELDYLVAELFANDGTEIVSFPRKLNPVVLEIARHHQVVDAFDRQRAVKPGSPLILTTPTEGFGPYTLASGRAGVVFKDGISLQPGQVAAVFKGAAAISYKIQSAGQTAFTAMAHAYLGNQPIPVTSVVGSLTVVD